MEKKKKIVFCLIIYVALFIALALYPANVHYTVERVPFFDTLYRSNLYIPFSINSIFFVYYLISYFDPFHPFEK